MLSKLIARLNSSKLLLGLAMLMLNIGSKYIEVTLSPSQIAVLKGGLAREMLIFAMAFMGTQELPLSLLITAAFVILSDHLLNEDSPYCIAPSYFHDKKKKSTHVESVSAEEEQKAVEVLVRARKQRESWWSKQ